MKTATFANTNSAHAIETNRVFGFVFFAVFGLLLVDLIISLLGLLITGKGR